MKKIIQVFIFFSLLITSCYGQGVNFINDSTLFSKGIYLENLKILVPWEINFNEIKKYGNPIITEDPKHYRTVQIKWDSVKILTGFKINLYILEPKKFLHKNVLKRVIVFKGLIDSITARELTSFFKQYTKRIGIFAKKKKVTFTRWIINNCSVIVGEDRSYGYFLAIEKMD
jgi:hypothetical protein